MEGKVVVITGASSGVGAATAAAFSKLGCNLVLHGRDEERLTAVVENCASQGSKVVSVLGDLKDDSIVANIINTTLGNFGTIDVLYNNAGSIVADEGTINGGGTVEALDDMYRLNLRVPYMLVQGFLPKLTASKGVIINCSSGAATIPIPGLTGYGVTKAAMDHLTKTLALTLGPKGVRVTGVNPGYLSGTAKLRKMEGDAQQRFLGEMSKVSPLEQKLATPEEIAEVVVFLASDKAASISGTHISCDRAISTYYSCAGPLQA